jgi:uncharacterized phage protein gp47/JayE
MSNYSDGNSFEDILARCLARVDAGLDKRMGSIIYDALAPACAELAQCYIALDVYSDQTYLLKAVGENLDNRVVDYGLTRLEATYAQRVITVYDVNGSLMHIDIGTRFSIPNAYGGYNFRIIEEVSQGNYIAECETAGAVGNDYVGELLPLMSINNLGTATITTVYKPGEDAETDDELRKRAIAKINQEAFAGNKAAYKSMVIDIDGVENVKVFPVWNGGGTVKLAIIATDNTIPSQAFIDNLQTLIDPVQNQGQGIGLAPIGHTVTVVAPDELDIDIEATITIDDEYTIEQLQSSIEANIQKYITEVQNLFSEQDQLIIYTSRVIAAILGVTQVKNVSNLTINGEITDLVINLSGTNVKFPMLNEVVLHES